MENQIREEKLKKRISRLTKKLSRLEPKGKKKNKHKTDINNDPIAQMLIISAELTRFGFRTILNICEIKTNRIKPVRINLDYFPLREISFDTKLQRKHIKDLLALHPQHRNIATAIEDISVILKDTHMYIMEVYDKTISLYEDIQSAVEKENRHIRHSVDKQLVVKTYLEKIMSDVNLGENTKYVVHDEHLNWIELMYLAFEWIRLHDEHREAFDSFVEPKDSPSDKPESE